MTLISLFLKAFLPVAFAAGALDPIRIQIGMDPKTLDPVRVSDLAGFVIIQNLVEPLMRTDGDGKVINGLAEKVEVSKDALTYKFKLRANAKWSDGENVTLAQCRDGLINAVDPKALAGDGELLYNIKGARPFSQGKGKREDVAVRVVKDQLVIELERVDPTFMMALTMPMAGPKRFATFDYKNPTTGRYFVRNYKLEDQIDLEPNPYFKETGQLPIQFKIVGEGVAARNLFTTGKVDVLSDVSRNDADEYRKNGTLRKFASYSVVFISFNSKKPPFNDPVWRKAIYGAINRSELGLVIGNESEPVQSYLPWGMPGRLETPAETFAAEVAKIKALKDKPRVTLSYGGSSSADIKMQKVQSDLKKNLDLDVDLQGMDFKFLLGQLKTDSIQMFSMSMSAPFNDPVNHLRVFTTDPVEKTSYTKYDNPKYRELIDRIMSTKAGPKRVKLIEEAMKLVQETDAIVVPLTQRQNYYAVSPRIKGFKVNPTGVISLSQLRR